MNHDALISAWKAEEAIAHIHGGTSIADLF